MVNNVVVDKPHHVTLQKQKGETGDGLLEVECWIPCVCVFVCVWFNAAANEGGGEAQSGRRKRQQEVGPFG